MITETVTYPAAMLAGLLSFLSPCIFPLIPAYFTFITGYSLEDLTNSPTVKIRKQVISSTIVYVLGFSLVFILMGASASFLGDILFSYSSIIRIFGGIIIIILGAHLLGLFRIKGLEFDKRIHIDRKPLHLLGTFVVGMAFGACWSPCVGPLLGSILIVAGYQETVTQGIILLSFYSAGLAIPFILISIFITFLLSVIKKGVRFMKYFNRIAGILLIAIGILLLTNKINILAGVG
jgi:cytochrome c-type biogenesis protein